MLTRIHHIGIAVKSLEEAAKLYTGPLGLKKAETGELAEEKVKIAYIQVGENKIELVAPASPESDIAKFIAENGEGLHHLAFEVKDIDAALAKLKAQGVPLIHQTPKVGVGGARFALFEPKGTKVLMEVVQPAKK